MELISHFSHLKSDNKNLCFKLLKRELLSVLKLTNYERSKAINSCCHQNSWEYSAIKVGWSMQFSEAVYPRFEDYMLNLNYDNFELMTTNCKK